MNTPAASPVTPLEPSAPVAVTRPPIEETVALAQAQKVQNEKAEPAQFASTPPAVAIVRDTRLVIEEDKETRTYIYKTLDRVTGEVIQQFPRDEILNLRDQPGYSPGRILSAST